MEFDDRKEDLIFRSGKRVYAYGNIVSVDPEGKLVYGYDGSFDESKLNINDCIELADEMIGRWEGWKLACKERGGPAVEESDEDW